MRVTAGEAIYAGGTITEKYGKDISGDTIVVALLPQSAVPDESTTGSAPDSDESPTPAQRTVKMLITTDTTPVGDYQLWGRITDTPEREWLRLDTVNAI